MRKTASVLIWSLFEKNRVQIVSKTYIETVFLFSHMKKAILFKMRALAMLSQFGQYFCDSNSLAVIRVP